ncbi:9052_t:CDS:1, partial [Gigaspora rosea]
AFPNNNAFTFVTTHFIDEIGSFQEIIFNFGLIISKYSRANLANKFFVILEDYKTISK